MGTNFLTQNPFAVLTFIVAPALLTNATSVLVMSTVNRMLRTRQRMQELFDKSEQSTVFQGKEFSEQVNLTEKQAVLQLRAMRWIYVSLGAFAAATLLTLLGAVAGQWTGMTVVRIIVGVSLALGLVGVGGLISGCMNLFRATRLSLKNIREEAALIRARQQAVS